MMFSPDHPSGVRNLLTAAVLSPFERPLLGSKVRLLVHSQLLYALFLLACRTSLISVSNSLKLLNLPAMIL